MTMHLRNDDGMAVCDAADMPLERTTRPAEVTCISCKSIADIEDVECMEADDDCKGRVEYRMALSATGTSYPRCDGHWAKRLDTEDEINSRYPSHQPSDFDPAYAGESWYEEEY